MVGWGRREGPLVAFPAPHEEPLSHPEEHRPESQKSEREQSASDHKSSPDSGRNRRLSGRLAKANRQRNEHEDERHGAAKKRYRSVNDA